MPKIYFDIMTVFISIKPYRTPSFVLSSIYSNAWVMGDVVKFFIYYLSSASIIKGYYWRFCSSIIY